LRETGLVTDPQRFSLKYIDLVDLGETPSLSYLNVATRVGGRDLANRPLQLRTEIEEEGLVHVLQIVCPAEARLGGMDSQPLSGVLVDIDTIGKVGAEDFWTSLETRVDLAHRLSKALFFSLLSPETLERLGPEY
jgi:uncharacterized protein (TIGR04255 family)